MNRIVLVLLLMLAGCSVNHSDCEMQNIRLNDAVYNKIVGCFSDSTEIGEWKYYDSLDRLSISGQFEHGVRQGLWKYLTLSNKLISWRLFEDSTEIIKTNLPDFLQVAKDSSGLISLELSDGRPSLQIVIILNNPVTMSTKIDSLHSMAEQEFTAHGLNFTGSRGIVSNEIATYHLDYYKVTGGTGGQYKVLSLYSYLNQDFLQVICKFEDSQEQNARLAFDGIVSNIYLRNFRFVNPYLSTQFEILPNGK